MIELSIEQVARATGAAVLVEGAAGVAGEVVIDSRAVAPGKAASCAARLSPKKAMCF